MAQTRTGRPGPKVNGNTRTKARSGAAKPQNKAAKPTRARSTSKPAGRASRNGSRSGAANGSARSTPSRAKQSSNGHGGVEAAKNAVADATSGAGNSIRSAAKGAKGPLLAGSAALAGLAGGVVLGAATRTGQGRRGKAPQGGLSYQIARPRNDGEGDWIVRRATRNGRRRDSPNARGGSSLETPLSRRGCTPRSDGETVNGLDEASGGGVHRAGVPRP